MHFGESTISHLWKMSNMGKTDIKIEIALDAIADYAQQYCDDNELPIEIETDDRFEDKIMLVITMERKLKKENK